MRVKLWVGPLSLCDAGMFRVHTGCTYDTSSICTSAKVVPVGTGVPRLHCTGSGVSTLRQTEEPWPVQCVRRSALL